MARATADPSKKAKKANAEDGENEGVTFVKNLNPHQQIVFDDGSSTCFKGNRVTITDPEVIEKIRAVSAHYKIFEA